MAYRISVLLFSSLYLIFNVTVYLFLYSTFTKKILVAIVILYFCILDFISKLVYLFTSIIVIVIIVIIV